MSGYQVHSKHEFIRLYYEKENIVFVTYAIVKLLLSMYSAGKWPISIDCSYWNNIFAYKC